MRQMQAADLTASANEIDNRMGPIPGRSSDRIANELRWAADELQRAMDMLGDVPGQTLTERLQNYIGCYMALQLKGAEADKMRAAIVEDDDEGADPAGTDLLKPRGNGGVVSAEICFNALLLMGDVDISEERVATWTPDNLATAYDWAMRRHLAASDNDDVIVPPRPAFIPVAKFGGF